MKTITSVALLGVLLGVACFATGCGGGVAGSTPSTLSSSSSPQVILTSIQVAPATVTIAKGLSQQFTATGVYSDGTSKAPTAGITWTVSPAGIASISNSGLANSSAEGQVTVTATSGTVSGTAQLTIGPAQVKSVAVNAPSTLMLGEQSAVTATATYTDGSTTDVTAQAQWSSSNPWVAPLTSGGATAAASQQDARRGDTAGTTSPQASASANQLGVTFVTAGVGGVTGSSKVVVLGYPRFAYLANMLDDSVSAYTINPDTGRLRANGYAFTVTTAFTNCFTVHPSHKFGYAVNFWPQGGQNGAQSSVSLLAIATDGSLTQVGAPMAVDTKPSCVYLHPSGKFAYLTSGDTNTITGYTVDAASGVLSPLAGTHLSLSGTPTNIAISPTGNFLHVATTSSIAGFAINDGTGALTPINGSPFVAWPTGNAIVIDPTARFAYVTNPNAADITVFQIDGTTGALTEIKDARVASGGLNPQRPVFDRTGQFLYVPNMLATWGANNGSIGAFRIDAKTGLLTPVAGSPFPAGQIPKDAAVDVDGLGKYFYVTDGNNFVRIYSIDSATGALTYVDSLATRAGIGSISLLCGPAPVSYEPTLAWVLDQDDGTITTLAFDSSAGLKPVAAIVPATVPPGATSLAVERNGNWAYVANPADGYMRIYQIDSAGALTPFYAFDLTGDGPLAVQADTSGTAVYLADSLANSISAFHHLSPVTLPGGNLLIPAGAAPSLLQVDPNDAWLYVYNSGDGTISHYELAPGFGYPTQVTWGPQPSPTAFAPGVRGMTIEPTGRYLYAVTGTSLLGFRIDYFNVAQLVPINSFPAIALNNAGAIAANVNGGWIYVADSAGVHVYAIDPGSGKLAESGTPIAVGTAPTAIAVDPSGTWLLVADKTLGVQPFAIDSGSGALAPQPAIVTGTSPLAIAVAAGVIH